MEVSQFGLVYSLDCQRSGVIRQIIYLALGYLVLGTGVNEIVLVRSLKAGVRTLCRSPGLGIPSRPNTLLHTVHSTCPTPNRRCHPRPQGLGIDEAQFLSTHSLSRRADLAGRQYRSNLCPHRPSGLYYKGFPYYRVLSSLRARYHRCRLGRNTGSCRSKLPFEVKARTLPRTQPRLDS